MNSTGVVHRRGFAILVLLAAVALAAYLVHARLGDNTEKARTGKPGKAAPAAVDASAPGNGPAYGADAGDGYGAAAAATSAPPAAAPAAPVGFTTTSLTAKTLPRMGNVVVDSGGWTLYRFDRDTANPPKSNCSGECATQWPPILVQGDPQVTGIDKNKVGTITRDDGSKQWAYKGKPLYYFVMDAAAGDKKGDGRGMVWHIAKP